MKKDSTSSVATIEHHHEMKKYMFIYIIEGQLLDPETEPRCQGTSDLTTPEGRATGRGWGKHILASIKIGEPMASRSDSNGCSLQALEIVS